MKHDAEKCIVRAVGVRVVYSVVLYELALTATMTALFGVSAQWSWLGQPPYCSYVTIDTAYRAQRRIGAMA